MNTAILESNLKALEARNPRLVTRLRQTAPAADCAFTTTAQNVLTLRLGSAQLASRVRPLDEADRLASTVSVIDNAVIVVLGFGLGYHVRSLAKQIRGTGIIVVFEPDLALLRAVLERVDHSSWIRATILLIFDDPDDRAEMSLRLDGAGAIVAQGTTFLEHPPSRSRLSATAAQFTNTFTQLVAALRTTLVTTLIHSVTTCRNLALNLDYYAAGDTLAPLADWAKGRMGILVAAGPSLARNVALLEDPTVRDRAVIICVQTALKPLLKRGIQPHFVTALDYHEISRQFYEGLDAEQVRDVTLICEPKANRAIIEAFPGHVRCTGNEYLDRLLGPLKREVGQIRAGATVAHLSFYLAQYLGCDPIVLIGQDLGFTEGLYYGPGAAIHEQWAPELNAFNTIEMMEWKRVTRMKMTLRPAVDQRGRSILVDEQMATYLAQFERDFAEAPQRVLDATQGGVVKRHTEITTLRQALTDHLADEPLPELPPATRRLDTRRVTEVRERVVQVRRKILRLGQLSREASRLSERMLQDQADHAKMARLFRKMDKCREEVGLMMDIFNLVGGVNQLGMFNRIKADRRIELSTEVDEMARQRLQLERDHTNTIWLADASDELAAILVEAIQVLDGKPVSTRIGKHIAQKAEAAVDGSTRATEAGRTRRVAAMIAVDPERSGLGIARRLDESFLGQSVLQCTLERLGRCRNIESIILLTPSDFDPHDLIDTSRIDRPIIVRHREDPLFDEAQRTIATARRWSDTCWRGGIGSMTIYDEIIRPEPMSRAMEEMQLDAALIVGPDWPFVDPSSEVGCDAIVARYREQPDIYQIVFTQAPPGLVGCVLSRQLMRDMTARTRSATIGALLGYAPQVPQLDPITKEMCVKLPAAIRTHHGRITFDTDRRRHILRHVFEPLGSDQALKLSSEEILELLDSHQPESPTDIPNTKGYEEQRNAPRRGPELPQQLEVELCADRLVRGPAARSAGAATARQPMSRSLFQRICRELALRDDSVLTLGGYGDPLLHTEFAELVTLAHEAGVGAINVRTDLLCTTERARALLDLPIDVITVLLNADCAATYVVAMGVDRFGEVIANLEELINERSSRAENGTGLTLPWIVPTLVRCPRTYEDIRPFVDRWLYHVGAVLIEPPPAAAQAPLDESFSPPADSLVMLDVPESVLRREADRRMLISCDGSVSPISACGQTPGAAIGSLGDATLAELWTKLREHRANQTIASLKQQPKSRADSSRYHAIPSQPVESIAGLATS